MPAGNYRLTDFAAAMGRTQLNRLDGIVEAIGERAQRYRDQLPELRFQRCPDGGKANHQTMGALMPAGLTRDDRDAFVAWMRSQGVEVGALSHAVHRLAPFAAAQAAAEAAGRSFLATEEIVDLGFALPLFPTLSTDDQDRVVSLVRQGLQREGS
jgi:dTDP-4-amino-4,6-dideoxygalactose transaminase